MFVLDGVSTTDSTFNGSVNGQAGILWNPVDSNRKLMFYGDESATAGDLVVSNGIVDLNTGVYRAMFTKLSRAVVGPTGQLRLHNNRSVRDFFAERLIVHDGARLLWGDDGTAATSTLHRVTFVASDGTATDLPPGVYGAADCSGVVGKPWMSGSTGFFKVDQSTSLWKTAQSGTWGTAENWTCGVPSAMLSADIIEPGGDYTVTVDAPAATTNLSIRNSGGGAATLNIASRLESTKGMWHVGSNGKMTITEGGEVVYHGIDQNVTTKFSAGIEAFRVAEGGEMEVRGKLIITNMCGAVALGLNGGSVTSKVVIAGSGEMTYHPNAKYDSRFRMYPSGCLEVKDYGAFRVRLPSEDVTTWEGNGGSFDFSGHSTFDLGYTTALYFGQGRTVLRDDATLIGGSNAVQYVTAAVGAPTYVQFLDRAAYKTGSEAVMELRPANGGRIELHFDSAATHSVGDLRMGVPGYNGFSDIYLSDGLLKADGVYGFNQGFASRECKADSFSTGCVYQTGGAFVVNGANGMLSANFRGGFILGDGFTSASEREPTALGVYRLSGGVVTNESAQSPFVLGVGRGRGEMLQTGGEFVSLATDAKAPAIFGFSNGYGYYVLSNGTASISSKLWVGGVNPSTCGHAHATYTGTESVGGITVAAADLSKPCRFSVADTVVLGGLGEGSLDVGLGGVFAGTDLVLSNNTASTVRLRVTNDREGLVDLSGKLTITDGASLVVDATGFTDIGAKRRTLMKFASREGSFAPGKITVLSNGAMTPSVSVTGRGVHVGWPAGVIITFR